MSSVAVGGASCQAGPSPTARALRLESLRADGLGSLDQLLDALPERPPWDVELTADDPVASLLSARGFEPYARVAVMARPIEGMARPPHVPGVRVEPYRNGLAEEFSTLERAALEGLAAFREIGQPSGYEQAEGFDAFCVARDRERLLGFAQSMVPEGWINWMGVAPDARRRGVGRAMVGWLAEEVRSARGTHLAALVERDTAGPPFLRALGFRERSQRTLLIRRA